MSTQEIKIRVPSILYKYMPEYAQSFFERQLIRFTPVNELNDPFELRPSYVDITQKLHNLIKKNYLPYNIDGLSLEIVTSKYADEAITVANKTSGYGVVSLSASFDNLLLWSHYTNNHTGIAIGFDIEHSFFKNLFSTGKDLISHVRYGNKRCDYSYEHERLVDATMFDWLTTKSPLWEYEEEWRIITRAIDEKAVVNGRKGFVDVPPVCVKHVILGIKRSQQTLDRAILFKNNNPHIELFLTYLHPKNFEIYCLPFNQCAQLLPKDLLYTF